MTCLKSLITGLLSAVALDGVSGVPAADSRIREIVKPVGIVAQADVECCDELLGPRHGQISEGEFGKGSGPILMTNAWLVLDFGRELHGGLQIGSGTGTGADAKLHVRFGESVAESLASLGERGACNDHAIRDDVIALPRMGRREIGETGFRFVRLANAGEVPIQLEYVRAVSLMRPMRQSGWFRCSDERLNRVFDTAVRTVHLCCQDYVWDGIKRDRLVWMGDMHPETSVILNVFGAAEVVPATLDYIAATTKAEKWANGFPTYTLWWLRNLAAWYRFTGDRAYLMKHADYLEATFEHVLTGMKDGMWHVEGRNASFLDWPTHHDPIAERAGAQALALMALRDVAFLGRELGRMNLVASAERVVADLEKLHPDPHGSKSAAALLALSGQLDPKTAYGRVLGLGGCVGVSTFYGYYMLEAMSAAGETRRALDTVRDYWGGMLDMGATSFWEDFNLAWTNNAFRIDEMPAAGKKDIHGDYGEFCYKGFRHSLCHGWSSGPAAWCISHVLGIRPMDVGCKTVEVKPFLGDLDWAEGAMALPNGESIRVRIGKAKGGGLAVDVSAPDWVDVRR